MLHSSALVLSLPSAGAQGLLARRTFRTGTSAPCALQCKHSRLASALNWRLACPHSSGLAVAPLRVGGGGPRRLWALLPCDAWRQPWLAPSVRGAAASCAMGLHGAHHCVDRRRRLRARVPLAPPCPASVVGLVKLTPNNRLDSLRCHERPLSFDMNAGPTPTPRPAPPTISANKMRTDPHRERRRGRAIHKCAPPAPPCTCPAASCTCPRPSRRHPNAMARPVIQQHQLRTTLAGPPLRPAPGVSRRSRIFKKKTVVYQADTRDIVVSGSYQGHISLIYQAKRCIRDSLIYH